MEDYPAPDPRSLTNYLSQAYLPPLILDIDLPQVEQYAPAWPRIPELDTPYTRYIQRIRPIPLGKLQDAVRTYFAGFGRRFRIDWDNAPPALPCPGIVTLGSFAMGRLVINNESDFYAALEFFVLDTAAEIVRTIERPPSEHLHHFRCVHIDSARHHKEVWRVYSIGPFIPPVGHLRPGMVVLAIPPWELGLGDLGDFTYTHRYGERQLDKDIGPRHWSNSDKVWAMLYDSCRVSGYRWFAVTNYKYWVFGTFSLRWNAAEVTEPLPFDLTRDMTIIEMLTFWLECSRNQSKCWEFAVDAPSGVEH
ncbi:hypothetical protein BV20DRAFT_1053953 [Pilatotrama ljubarskyi]|nr:hypothetical protein BV20DRAFT_1053953 [Pilatotrama ljubarskyi]